MIWRTVSLSQGPFSFTSLSLSQLIKNQIWLVCSFYTVLKLCIETIKNSEHCLQKIKRSFYVVLLSKSWKGLEPVSSLQNIEFKMSSVAVISDQIFFDT